MSSNKKRFTFLDHVLTMLRDHAESLTLVLILAVLVRMFVLSSFYLGSSAMEPTLLNGDFILGFRPPFGLQIPGFSTPLIRGRSPRRGELVVLRCPHDDSLCLKRVVGLPGDKVEFFKQRLKINDGLCQYETLKGFEGKGLVTESCKNFSHSIDTHQMWPEELGRAHILLPHQIYVLNDNRGDLEDSRTWGPLSMDQLKATVWGVWFSLDWGSSSQEAEENSSHESYRPRWSRLFQSVN